MLIQRTFFVNVTEDVLETIRASERAEAAYERKMYRYKAQYSLDCENGIENTVLTKPQTPEIVLEEKQLQKQVYFRHSCTFCTPHFFYINSNKTTAGRTKAIHNPSCGPHNTLAIRFTYCLYRSIPFFSSINFPSKISCNTCLHGIRCNLLTSDASITRKVVW